MPGDSSTTWLEANMQQADFADVLHGEDLARTYANMDVFAFPSHTDAFGNVVLEALASASYAIAPRAERMLDSGRKRRLRRHAWDK
jgi:glycosyltransferase involved in cell wall biosynthesis